MTREQPDDAETEGRIRQLRDAMSRMSTSELCGLLQEIQARMRGVSTVPDAAIIPFRHGK